MKKHFFIHHFEMLLLSEQEICFFGSRLQFFFQELKVQHTVFLLHILYQYDLFALLLMRRWFCRIKDLLGIPLN